MDTAARTDSWERLRTLLELARPDEERFASFEDYWLLRAQLATHDERHRDAQDAYRSALLLQPELRAAQVGLLWSLIENDHRPELDQALVRWREAAGGEPALWAAYAVGYDQLGRLDEALFWYRREAAAHPGHHEFLIRYADALARSGKRMAAWRLRRHVLARLRPRALVAARTPMDPRARPLLRAYTALVRDEGDEAQARAWMERLHVGAEGDREAEEMLVAWYIDLEQPEEAARWIGRLDAERRRSPAWQRLAVTLANNDLQAAASILAGEAETLSLGDRVEAEVRLGHDEAALRAADRAGDGRRSDEELLSVARQAADVRARTGSHVEADWRLDVLGPLALDTYQVRGDFAAGRGLQLGGRAAFTTLHADPGALELGRITSELDVGARLGWHTLRSRLAAAAGANLRAAGSAPWLTASFDWDAQQRTRLRADLAVGEITPESPTLRAAGNRSQAGASLVSNLTARDYAVGNLAYNQYRARDFAFIAQGLSASAEVGHRLSLAHPAWRLRLTGGYVAAAHAAALPASAAALLPPESSPQALIPPQFAQAGFGVQLGEGDPLSDGPSAPGWHYIADAWAGWGWPPNHLVYHAQLGIAVPVSQAGGFHASAYYGNDYVGASSGQPFEGLQLMYTHRL
jgi:tetratricopeptide (TPR) repeat protein